MEVEKIEKVEMVEVKLLNKYSHPSGCFKKGKIISVPKEESEQLIDGKYAELAPQKKIIKDESAGKETADSKKNKNKETRKNK